MLVVQRSCGRRRSHPRGLRRAERSGYYFGGHAGRLRHRRRLGSTSLQGGRLRYARQRSQVSEASRLVL